MDKWERGEFMGSRPILHIKAGVLLPERKPAKRSNPLTINRSELIRRKQALIRSGERQSFTHAVKARNTPSGAAKPSARFLKSYDPKQRAAEQSGARIKDVGQAPAMMELFIPADVLVAHAVHVVRGQLGLRKDHLVRQIPTLDKPKPKHHEVTRPVPKELTIYERKLWKKMSWYKPGMFLDAVLAERKKK